MSLSSLEWSDTKVDKPLRPQRRPSHAELSRSHTHTHTISLSRTHSHTHTHTISLSRAHTNTHTRFLSQAALREDQKGKGNFPWKRWKVEHTKYKDGLKHERDEEKAKEKAAKVILFETGIRLEP